MIFNQLEYGNKYIKTTKKNFYALQQNLDLNALHLT